ncbi:MAG: precorrin-6Y C5,15-methyltransferase (decarboxylating) subunit CbiT [Clostridiales bacterium]
MKQVFIIGTGPNPAQVSGRALAHLQEAEVLIGAARMVEPFAYLGKTVYPVYQPDKVAQVIKESSHSRFAVPVSGDVGFFSAAAGINEALQEANNREAGNREGAGQQPGQQVEVHFIPGLSSLASFFAKLKMAWQDAALLSLHGAAGDIAGQVRRHRKTFCLTGNNLPEIGQTLINAGYGSLPVYIGENLDYENEQITKTTVAALAETSRASLAVLLIINEDFDSRVRAGIADEEFFRGDIPMTKAEVRAVTLAKLAVSPGDICYDIGAGTGSVTVEMALAAYGGQVFAIEQKGEAIALIEENCRRFHVGNVTPILGQAPAALATLEALEKLPAADVVFIGGSGGRMKEILEYVTARNPRVRIAINAIALENLASSLELLTALGLPAIEVIQVSVAKANKVAELHMMMAQNPIFIISAGGKRSDSHA